MGEDKNNKQPVIGVITSKKKIKLLLKQRNVRRLTSLNNANKSAIVTLYFFSLEGVDLLSKRIKGVHFNIKKGLWERVEFPYPDFIYRTSNISKRDKKEIIDKLLQYNIKPLNYFSRYNKWESYNKLSKDGKIAKYLPKTYLYKTHKDLRKILKDNNKIYLKACKGGRGREVLRITKLYKGNYRLHYMDKEVAACKFNNLDDLISRIEGFYGRKKFIIQEAIDLITMNKRLVDFRAEAQKDGKGEIIISAISVRVGQRNAHITTHAGSYPFNYFLKDIMQYSDIQIKKLETELKELLIMVYKQMENLYGISAEIGIDVGLDKKGRLWYIESNACSMKVSLYKTYDRIIIEDAFKNLLEYARYLYTIS